MAVKKLYASNQLHLALSWPGSYSSSPMLSSLFVEGDKGTLDMAHIGTAQGHTSIVDRLLHTGPNCMGCATKYNY